MSNNKKKKEKKVTGNQYQADPRQAVFLKAYLDPSSETFANAYQSAIKSGYSVEYAKTILSQDLDWLSENLRDEQMVKLAVRNLKEGMEIDPYEIDELGRMKINGSVFKTKVDVSKFVAERLSDKYNQKVKTEHSGIIKTKEEEEEENIDIDKLAEEVAKKLKIKKTK